MSLAAFNQYKLQIARGTCDLALIDAAERKRYVTAQEASSLRTIWRDTYEVRGLTASASDAREVVVAWTSPTVSATTNTASASVRLVRSTPAGESTVNVNASARGYTWPADLGPDATDILVTATVIAPNLTEGPSSTAETFVPDAPAPTVTADAGEQETEDPTSPATDVDVAAAGPPEEPAATS